MLVLTEGVGLPDWSSLFIHRKTIYPQNEQQFKLLHTSQRSYLNVYSGTSTMQILPSVLKLFSTMLPMKYSA